MLYVFFVVNYLTVKSSSRNCFWDLVIVYKKSKVKNQPTLLDENLISADVLVQLQQARQTSAGGEAGGMSAPGGTVRQ